VICNYLVNLVSRAALVDPEVPLVSLISLLLHKTDIDYLLLKDRIIADD